jgi:peptidoglycan/LPS O-acetylase OafA/YrhL
VEFAMTSTRTATRTPSAVPTGSRAPWTVHQAAVPLGLMAAVTCVGAVYFGTHPDPVRPDTAPSAGSWQAWTLIVVLLCYAVTALAAAAGLYRRSRTAWAVALGFLAAHGLFGALKYFGLGEDAALTFLVVDVVVLAGLLAPATRSYVAAPALDAPS